MNKPWYWRAQLAFMNGFMSFMNSHVLPSLSVWLIRTSLHPNLVSVCKLQTLTFMVLTTSTDALGFFINFPCAVIHRSSFCIIFHIPLQLSVVHFGLLSQLLGVGNLAHLCRRLSEWPKWVLMTSNFLGAGWLQSHKVIFYCGNCRVGIFSWPWSRLPESLNSHFAELLRQIFVEFCSD